MKTIFNFHPETHEFIGSATADESPLEPGVFLFPMYATETEPPEPSAHEIAVFEKKKWKLKPDWRGVPLFSVSDGSPVSIDQIGTVPADIQATDLPPESPFHSWSDGVWTLDQVKVSAQLKIAKSQAFETINGLVSGIRIALAGTSDALEVAGWPNKLRIAQAIDAGTATDVERSAFQTEVDRRGVESETLEVFAAKVIRNSGMFSQIAGELDGLKRNATDAISAALNEDELQSVVDAHIKKINTSFNRS